MRHHENSNHRLNRVLDHVMGRRFAERAARQALPAQPARIGVVFDDPDPGPEANLRH